MKGPPKSKGMKGMKGMGGSTGPKQGLVTGGNMSGLSAGLSSARPVKQGRMASLKKSMFGGGM
jgi:hypothetical protein